MAIELNVIRDAFQDFLERYPPAAGRTGARHSARITHPSAIARSAAARLTRALERWQDPCSVLLDPTGEPYWQVSEPV